MRLLPHIRVRPTSRNTVQIRGGPAAVIGDGRLHGETAGPLVEKSTGKAQPDGRSESQKTCWQQINEGRNPMAKGFGKAICLPTSLPASETAHDQDR